jgi:release factor glutamine methyltransferase
LLDVGTGSGCVAVSCARLLPGSTVYAIDISPGAIDLATVNAARNAVHVHFAVADIFTDEVLVPVRKFDAIVSNPPYISSEVYATLQPEITDFEPRIAETDGSDGLSFYRRLARFGKMRLKENGLLAVEHAYDQQRDVMTIFTDEGWRSVISVKDYSGNPRCVIAREFS